MTERTYQVDRRTHLGDWPLVLLLAADVAFGLWGWSRAAEAAWLVVLAPVFVLGIYVLLLFLPVLDPRRENYGLFLRAYRILRWAVPLLLAAVHVTLTLDSLGAPVDGFFIMRLAFSLLLLVVGNIVGLIRPNRYTGYKTPWTLANDEVWVRTHRAAGRLWVVCGLIQLAALALPLLWGVAAFAGTLVIVGFAPVLHSYVLYRRIVKRG